jgi:hypothetical protein
MKQCNKIKNSCTGNKTYAACTIFEGDVNEDSALFEDSCDPSLEETTQDLYDQIGAIKNNQDLSDLGNACLEYVEDEDGKIIVKNVLIKLEEEICTLKTEIETLKNTAFCDLKITDCGLDLECLTGACDNDVVTVKDLFQSIITKICETT